VLGNDKASATAPAGASDVTLGICFPPSWSKLRPRRRSDRRRHLR
jgi:hypothetical protein